MTDQNINDYFDNSDEKGNKINWKGYAQLLEGLIGCPHLTQLMTLDFKKLREPYILAHALRVQNSTCGACEVRNDFILNTELPKQKHVSIENMGKSIEELKEAHMKLIERCDQLEGRIDDVQGDLSYVYSK